MPLLEVVEGSGRRTVVEHYGDWVLFEAEERLLTVSDSVNVSSGGFDAVAAGLRIEGLASTLIGFGDIEPGGGD